jgi:hypothetical protein
MVVLDTDHASELGFRSAVGLRLLERLGASGEDAVITAITVEAALILALAITWWTRDSRKSVVVRSTSPDGRWRIIVSEHCPVLLASPYIYTFSISANEPSQQSSVDYIHNNDSAKVDDFQIDWSPQSATFFWGNRNWSVRAETVAQPIHWVAVK